jgi:hypothetical protein
MLEEPDPESDPPEFTIWNGYIFFLDTFCVGKISNGYLGLHMVGEVEPRDMTICMPITVESAPPAFEMFLKLETEDPICPQNDIDVGSQVNNVNSPRYYLTAGDSEHGVNSCGDHRFPRGLTPLAPFSETIHSGIIAGSVLTVQSTK